jgi:ATP-dependent helicase/DNAse subunit B
MQLLQLLPQGDFAHVWLLLDIIISACTLMLTHAISGPTTTQHELKDLELVEPVFTLLNFLNDTSRAQDVAKMAESLRALKKEAEVAKNAAEKHVRVDEVPGIGSKSIRSLEEFVGRIQELSSKRCAEFRATGLRGE